MPRGNAPTKLTKAEIIAQNTAAKNAHAAGWTDYWNKRKGHITKGENKQGKPVGYHTKLLDGHGALCKGVGATTPIPNSFGCYSQSVAVLSDTSGDTKKQKTSTFYPDTWTLADIETVCKSAYLNATNQDLGKNFSSKSSAAPGIGLPLRFSADSIYPDYEH